MYTKQQTAWARQAVARAINGHSQHVITVAVLNAALKPGYVVEDHGTLGRRTLSLLYRGRVVLSVAGSQSGRTATVSPRSLIAKAPWMWADIIEPA